jgi:acetyl esterase/lipase
MTRRALFGVAAVAAAQHSLDILELPPPKADARIPYGRDPQQFGDLRVPSGKGPHPVVIFLHGGFWKAAYSLEHAGHACAALTRAGAATWSLEYRRIGDAGGGWPGTFDDIRSGAGFVKELAKDYAIDVNRVVVAGHSAGGHLAVWLAAQKALPLKAAIALAGVVDLRRAWELKLSSGIVEKFLGGSPQQVAGRYAQADPIELLPMRVPQRLVHGTVDDVVPFEISERFARKSGNARLIPLEGAGHFELVDPRTPEWKTVAKTILDWS